MAYYHQVIYQVVDKVTLKLRQVLKLQKSTTCWHFYVEGLADQATMTETGKYVSLWLLKEGTINQSETLLSCKFYQLPVIKMSKCPMHGYKFPKYEIATKMD